MGGARWASEKDKIRSVGKEARELGAAEADLENGRKCGGPGRLRRRAQRGRQGGPGCRLREANFSGGGERARKATERHFGAHRSLCELKPACRTSSPPQLFYAPYPLYDSPTHNYPLSPMMYPVTLYALYSGPPRSRSC